MRQSGAEILVRIRNLSVCRAFYRDVLALGAPSTDSNFLCRFSLGRNVFLTLEPVAGDEAISNAPWLFQPDDPELVLDNLSSYGYRTREITVAERSALEILDPEQNPVYLVE